MILSPWRKHAYIQRTEHEDGNERFNTFTDLKLIGYGVKSGTFRASFKTRKEAKRDLDQWWRDRKKGGAA